VGRAVACLRQTCAVSPARRLCERQIMKFFPIAVFGTMMSFSVVPVALVAEDQRSNGMVDTHIVQQAGSNDVRNSTPAQLRVAAAKLQIKADPKRPEAYNGLALALLRRARETADPAYNRE